MFRHSGKYICSEKSDGPAPRGPSSGLPAAENRQIVRFRPDELACAAPKGLAPATLVPAFIISLHAAEIQKPIDSKRAREGGPILE